MQAADALVEGDDDLHLSDEEDDEVDKMSLASDLDDEDLEEVEQRERELERKAPKKKWVVKHLAFKTVFLKNTQGSYPQYLLFCLVFDSLFVFPRVKFAEEEEEDEEQGSGLLVELEGKDEKKERETNLWFSKVFPLVLPYC